MKQQGSCWSWPLFVHTEIFLQFLVPALALMLGYYLEFGYALVDVETYKITVRCCPWPELVLGWLSCPGQIYTRSH